MLHAYDKCCYKGNLQCISVAEFEKTPNYTNKEGETCFVKKKRKKKEGIMVSILKTY